MAQKYPGGPPPYSYKAQPQVYVAPATVVVQHKPAPGLLESLGKTIDKELNYLGKKVDNGIATCAAPSARSPILSLFCTGNVLQLVSRASGRTLQIVLAPTKQLVVDGAGLEGPQNTNTLWTVINEGHNVVKLHNNNNFLCIVNGATMVVNFPSAAHTGVEAKFQLVQIGQFILLRSVKEPGRHVGILPTGQLKPALATGSEDHAHFGVRLIYTPYKK